MKNICKFGVAGGSLILLANAAIREDQIFRLSHP